MNSIIKVKRDVPSFTIVYNDFIDSEGILSANEKLVFLILLRYGENPFPSMNTIAKKCNLTRRTIVNVINSLEQKGILTRVNRKHKNGGKTSNYYILKDYREIWESKSEEELQKATEPHEITKEEFERMAMKFGYVKKLTDDEFEELAKEKGFVKADDNKKEFESTSQTTTEKEVKSNSNQKNYYYNNIKEEQSCQDIFNGNIAETKNTKSNDKPKKRKVYKDWAYDEENELYADALQYTFSNNEINLILTHFNNKKVPKVIGIRELDIYHYLDSLYKKFVLIEEENEITYRLNYFIAMIENDFE